MSDEIKKVCTKCGKPKSLDQFYRGGGSFGRAQPCKVCKDAKNKQWTKDHPEEVRRIQRKYRGSEKARNYQTKWRQSNQKKVRDYSRKWVSKNPDKQRVRNKRFRENNPSYQRRWARKNQTKVYKYHRNYVTKFPERDHAHVAVRMAIKRGDLPPARTLACINCGQRAAEYHHHKGYAKKHWLDVVPTCRSCHKKLEAR